ncbi:odorant receptor 131-2-like [Aulostomus maculatus]
MSSLDPSQTNVTAGLQYQGLLERMLFTAPITLSCCVFLLINGVMLFTLRSKPVFRETPRYILLYNLLFGDTAQLVMSQLMYLLAACQMKLSYPVCGVLFMIALLTNDISPLTLVLMSLERYVAVCYPLRHATIISIRNTGLAIITAWSFSLLNVVIRVILLLQFPFQDLQSLQMKDTCSTALMFLVPASDHFDKAYTGLVFASAGVAVISSYIGVIVAARSASTDKASAHKGRKTLLLHLMQLSLSLLSTMHSPAVLSITRTLQRLAVVRIKNVFYVGMFLLPRCLSSLIYGLRDQTIRPVLIYHLCCGLKLNPQSLRHSK